MSIKVFFSYSHKDEEYREDLETHLSILKWQNLISTWHDRKILAGSEVDSEIDENLNEADVILLLISADFIKSPYCYQREMQRAMERHNLGEVRVIPVILRKVDNWQDGTPFGKLLALPRDGKPVATWQDRDEAFANIAEGIRYVIGDITKQRLKSE